MNSKRESPWTQKYHILASSLVPRCIRTYNRDGINQMKFLSCEKVRGGQPRAGFYLFSFCCINKLPPNLVAENNNLFLLFCAVVGPLPCSLIWARCAAAASGRLPAGAGCSHVASLRGLAGLAAGGLGPDPRLMVGEAVFLARGLSSALSEGSAEAAWQ